MAHPTPSSSPCALVVDDDPFIRMDALDILENAGFDTMEAAHADAALKLLQERHTDLSLLFTDVHMPGEMDGFALARYAANRWPHISIVVASGEAKPAPGDLPDSAHFIAKPFSAQIVHDHLNSVLPEDRKPEPLRKARRPSPR
ncbi:response regulator [Methylobacterium komagatae]|uniref:Response regulator n=1 Tax=Methylobacterium komagatae TaxID=374425 RepID=A0ABW2BMN7_9HYPH